MTRYEHLMLKSVLLLSLVTATVCKRRISPFEYLNLPQRDELDSEFHQLISRSLLGVDFASASSLELVCRLLEEATQNERIEPERREICKKILDLSRDGEPDCSRAVHDIYQSAWAQMMANFGRGLGRFYTYLRVFGQRHFELCAKQVAQMDAQWNVGPVEQIERDFRELYGQTLGLANDADGDLLELLPKLAKLDLATGDFDGRRMVEVAKALSNSTQRASNSHPIGFVRDFALARCEQLLANKQVETLLDVVGWSRCLGSEVDFDEHLLLLAEYRRLCIAWTRPSTRHLLEANIQRQLPSSSNHNETARASSQLQADEESGRQ